MESILGEETPLAAFLEGQGSAGDSLGSIEDSTEVISSESTFAPTANHTFRARLSNKLPEPLPSRPPKHGTISRAHVAWSRAVNSRLGRAENTQFLEHFRYILVASQLLNEYPDHASLQGSRTSAPDGSTFPAVRGDVTSVSGVTLVAGLAFTIVWLIQWAKRASFSKSRLLLILAGFSVTATISYAFARRQWLKHLRNQALHTASILVANLHAFELSTGAALSLVQEVELVSKGYRVSLPLPPISRLDDTKRNRKCARLRKCLRNSYCATLDAYKRSSDALGQLQNENDLEKYLEIYDIPQGDVPDVSKVAPDEDAESLKALRLSAYQCSVLRRFTLCLLLSLDADGGKPDFERWRAAIEVMDSLSQVAATGAQSLSDMLRELEEFTVPTTPKASRPTTERLRSQVHKISTLSQGIRSLQAKMALLREESNRSIEESEDLTDLGPSLLSQYDSIGTDLRSLMQAWETGKTSLASNIDKQERRISLASSGMRSPGSTLSGLIAVEEGGPEDALRALNGESVSNRSSIVTAPDEEVFEAVGLPRQRSSLTREERLVKMQEERVRQAELREKRASNTNMIRELQSVINLRPQNKRHSMGL